MVKTINQLSSNVTPLGTDKLPTGKGGSNPDLSTTLTQLAAFSQAAFANKSNIIYVSDKQLGTGTGTNVNPFATIAEAHAVAVANSVIKIDGVFTVSDYASKPVLYIGYGKYQSRLIISNLTLNDTVWQATTSPRIGFIGIGVSGNITLTASVEKANSSVIVDDAVAGSFNPTKMGLVTVNNSIAPIISGSNCNLSVDSSLAATSISMTLDGTTSRKLRVNNTITPTINGTCPANVLTISVTNVPVALVADATSLNDVIFDAPYGSLQLVLDDTGYPVNGWTDTQGGGFLEPIWLTNLAKGVSSFRGLTIGYDPAQAWGTYAGATAGIDSTFFWGRGAGSGIPPTGLANYFFGTYFNQNDKNNCFAAADGSSSAIPTAHQQFIFSYLNGYTFGGVPRANYSVKAGNTGDHVFSAVGEVDDAKMNNNEINTMIDVNDVIVLKTKNNSAAFNRTTLGMMAEPILHTVSGDTLLINRRHNININTLNQCSLGGFLRRGDQVKVTILGTGKTRIGSFGSQAIKFLDIDVTSANYICSNTQYSTLWIEWTENDTITVIEATGNWFVETSGGSLVTNQNILGINPILKGITTTAAINSSSSPAFTAAPVSYDATSGSTISAADFINGIIPVNPSVNQTITGPSQTLLDAALVAKFGSFALGQYVEITYDNQSAFTSTLTVGAGCLLSISNTGPGGTAITVPPHSSQSFKIYKTSGTPTFFLFGGSLADSGSGDALLAADNIFTGQNTFSGAANDFQRINSIYTRVSGPAIVTASLGFSTNPSAPLTTNSFTLTGSQVVNVGVVLNGGLAAQTVFMPTASDFESALLASFPGGSTIPVGASYWMRVINISATATATLTANTAFLINNATSSTFLPGKIDNVLIVKTNTLEYTVY